MTRPVQHTAAAVAGWLREGRRVVAGLLVEVDGSSPLDVGASMYIDDQGGIEGSITGGCVEGAVAAAAMEMLDADGAPQLVTYGISDELAGTVGLMCGGIVHIFIHELKGARARRGRCSTSRRRSSTAPPRWSRCSTASSAGAKLFVDDERRAPAAWTAGELLDKNAAPRGPGPARTRAARACATSAPTAPSLGSGLRVYASIQAEPPRMVVFGAIDFSSALAPLAKGLGYKVTIADPRSAFLKTPPLLRRRRDRGRLARQGPRRRRARPARRGPDLHPRPEARRARRAGRARHRRRLHRRAGLAQHDRGPQPPAARRRRDRRARSSASSRPAAWTSAPRRSRRPRSPCWPRSSPTAPGATDNRCGRPKGRSATPTPTPTNDREETAWPIPSP